MRRTLLGLLALLLGACAAQTKLPAPVRAVLSARYAGTTVELRQSVYYGDLYDENEKWLLSPYPFAETYHIVDTRGAPIRPRGQRGILPAGTAFVLEKIEFPDAAAMARRMLTTPRYHPWIYLTPAAGTVVPEGRKYFVLLLPMDLESEAAAEAAIRELLGRAGTVKRWLAARRPTVRVAIEHKDVVAGMTPEELVASMGEPQRWFHDTTTTTGAAARVAWYPSKEAWLVDGAVAEVRPGRALEPTPPESAAVTNTAGRTDVSP